MNYSVTIGGRQLEVEVEGQVVKLNGKTVTARLESVPGSPLRYLVANGVTRAYVIQRTRDSWLVQECGRSWTVDVVDERKRRLRDVTGKHGGRREANLLKAPMPGLVLRVSVTDGDEVEPGTPLLVLEAMKMENEIKAVMQGVVRAVHVREGDAVEKGAPLVQIG